MAFPQHQQDPQRILTARVLKIEHTLEIELIEATSLFPPGINISSYPHDKSFRPPIPHTFRLG